MVVTPVMDTLSFPNLTLGIPIRYLHPAQPTMPLAPPQTQQTPVPMPAVPM